MSIAGTILQNRLYHWLEVGQLPIHIADEITAYVPTLNAMPESQFADVIRLAVARSHRNLAETLLGFTAIGLLLMVKLRNGDMNKTIASKQRIEKKKPENAVMLTDIDDREAWERAMP